MTAMKSPARIPESKPTHGLALPRCNFLSAAYVTAAAVKAPASIFPSSAMLMTPERSENSPPSAASTSGVANLMVDAIKEKVKMSLIRLGPQALRRPDSAHEPFEKRFSRNEENDDSLQHLHDVFRDVLGKAVDVNAAVLQHREQQRRENHADRMIPAEQRHGNAGETVIVGKPVVVTIAITHHFVDGHHARQSAGN